MTQFRILESQNASRAVASHIVNDKSKQLPHATLLSVAHFEVFDSLIFYEKFK